MAKLWFTLLRMLVFLWFKIEENLTFHVHIENAENSTRCEVYSYILRKLSLFTDLNMLSLHYVSVFYPYLAHVIPVWSDQSPARVLFQVTKTSSQKDVKLGQTKTVNTVSTIHNHIFPFIFILVTLWFLLFVKKLQRI